MKRSEAWSLHLAALAMGLSGLLYGWLKYFHQRAGDFGPEPCRLQGWSQHAHVLAGPLLVFALGMMVRGHVLPALRSGTRRGRRTGIGAALLLAPMILAGYGMQVCVDPAWRGALAWVHGPASLLFLAAYGSHLLRRGRRNGLAHAQAPEPQRRFRGLGDRTLGRSPSR